MVIPPQQFDNDSIIQLWQNYLGCVQGANNDTKSVLEMEKDYHGMTASFCT
jgi:hypothetical protein